MPEHMRPLEPASRPNPFYFRCVTSESTLLMWEVLFREPPQPERFDEPEGVAGPDDIQLFAVGYLIVAINVPEVEVLVAGHPNLTDIESVEVANQAEVIAREAALEHERILD